MLVVRVDDIKMAATKEVTASLGIVSRERWIFRRLNLVEMLSDVSVSPNPAPSPLLCRWTSDTCVMRTPRWAQVTAKWWGV